MLVLHPWRGRKINCSASYTWTMGRAANLFGFGFGFDFGFGCTKPPGCWVLAGRRSLFSYDGVRCVCTAVGFKAGPLAAWLWGRGIPDPRPADELFHFCIFERVHHVVSHLTYTYIRCADCCVRCGYHCYSTKAGAFVCPPHQALHHLLDVPSCSVVDGVEACEESWRNALFQVIFTLV